MSRWLRGIGTIDEPLEGSGPLISNVGPTGDNSLQWPPQMLRMQLLEVGHWDEDVTVPKD